VQQHAYDHSPVLCTQCACVCCVCVCVLCVCTTACVYLGAQSACLILRSSPIHPLILLTYSPNPVIPGSFFSFHPARYPFIPLSLARIHCPSVPASHSGPAPFSLPRFPPPPPPNHLSCSPCIPPDSIPASLSRCLKAWHGGFLSSFFSPGRVHSLPSENAVQRNCNLISAN